MSEYKINPELQQHERIALADPLRLDERLSSLPVHNQNGDTVSIGNDLDYAVSIFESNPPSTGEDSLAALRDMDFLVASLVRHGESPTEYPQVERVMMELAEKTGNVPRGTVYTYAMANPIEPRQRSFINSPEEQLFINTVRDSAIALERASGKLSGLDTIDLDLNQAHDALNSATNACDYMVASIVQVHRNISPEHFTNEMRPFFEPYDVDGETYYGPGGAQLQLLVIERMLSGYDPSDPTYEDFYGENYRYLPASQREYLDIFEKTNKGRGLLDWAYEEDDAEFNFMAVRLLRTIRKFRYPHKKVADENFKIRPEEAVGSGSYKPDILQHLIARTNVQIEEISFRDDVA